MLGNTNAKIVSDGSDVEILETQPQAYYRCNGDFVPSNSSWSIIGNTVKYKNIEEPFFNQMILATGDLSGEAKNIKTCKVTVSDKFYRNETSSIYFDYGQVQNSSLKFNYSCAISPDKQYVVVCGINSNTNIYVLKLTKSGDDYIFDTSFTTISIDTTVTGNTYPIFLTYDTFACLKGTNVNIYKIENNTISLVKTITLDFTPNKPLFSIGKNLIVANSSTMKVIDTDTETILYTESTSLSLNSLDVIDNYIIVARNNTSTPFYIYSINNNIVTKEKFTKTGTYQTNGMTNFKIIKKDNNKVYALTNSSMANYLISIVVFDFSNNTISKMFTPSILTSSQNIATNYYIENENTFYIYNSYTTSIYDRGRFLISYQEINTKISYDNTLFTLGEFNFL